MHPTTIQLIAAGLFAAAILHSFSSRFLQRLAHARPAHAGLWHLLAEVEVVFGFWSMILVFAAAAVEGPQAATQYLDSRDFTEPMFVFAILVVAGSRPILHCAMLMVRLVARLLPLPGGMPFYFVALCLVPLLGSLITEPAAMTLAALILRERFFSQGLSSRLKYATLGVLFVNVSIGGTLTPFAAPPVLMVAGKWGWDIAQMLAQFGWRAAIAVAFNAAMATLLFGKELRAVEGRPHSQADDAVPLPMIVLHLSFLAGIVVMAHHPPAFLGLFLLFLGVAQAYPRHHGRLLLREGLLVAFFLAGLVLLGGLQQWWLSPLLQAMNENQVYFGATALTAITDNAALTYLGSLVDGLSDSFKYALVAGAVTGGGLTIIANAPNPAGVALLRRYFDDEVVSPLGLLVAAAPPTLAAVVAFWLL